MVDHKARENRKYLLFLGFIIVFAVAFVKVKAFYALRLVHLQNETREYERKIAMAKKLRHRKDAFSRELNNNFSLVDSYRIIEKINRLQARYKVNIDSIKPLPSIYNYFSDANKYLKQEIDWLGFSIVIKGGYYNISNLIKAIEDMGGIIQRLNFNFSKGELRAEIRTVFVVRKKKKRDKI